MLVTTYFQIGSHGKEVKVCIRFVCYLVRLYSYSLFLVEFLLRKSGFTVHSMIQQ